MLSKLRQCRGVLTTLTILLELASTIPATAQDAYLLRPGDIVEVALSGLPDMTVRTEIQIDGSITIPGVGTVAVAGTTMEATRVLVRTAMASQIFSMYLADGQEVQRTFNRDEVSVSVVGYGPVFVTGDVLRPGELTYRPGMTARQAVAAAGGAGIVQTTFQAVDPVALRVDYGEAWHAGAAASARVWRLRSELDEGANFPRQDWPAPEQSNITLDAILTVEQSIADARAAALVEHKEFLGRQIALMSRQITVLRGQLAAETENEGIEATALVAAQTARERGTLTESRLSDIRGAALISATRRLQTEASLMQLERARMEAENDRSTLDSVRRLEILAELQEARVSEGREATRLAAAAERLTTAGLTTFVGSEPIMVIEIVRAAAADMKPQVVEIGTVLEPGDVVAVSLRSEPQISPHCVDGAKLAGASGG